VSVGSTVKSVVKKQRGGRQDAGLNKAYILNQKEAYHHEGANKETFKGYKVGISMEFGRKRDGNWSEWVNQGKERTVWGAGREV